MRSRTLLFPLLLAGCNTLLPLAGEVAHRDQGPPGDLLPPADMPSKAFSAALCCQ
jgi:hypothetical protein